MAMSVKVSGAWKSVPYPRVKVSGSWKSVQNIYTKVSGAWKPLYSYWFDVGEWGGCSASCGGGTQTRTVQCKRTGGVACSDDFCTRAGLTVPARSQACNTQGCTTCGYSYPYHAWQQHMCPFSDSCSTSCTPDKLQIYDNGVKIYFSSFSYSVSIGGYTYTRGAGPHSDWNDDWCLYSLCKTPN